MSATLLYHMLGIRGYKFVKQKVVPGGIEFYIECREPTCPCCGSANVWRKGGKVRTFRSLPIGKKKTTIIMDVPRVFCHDCKALKQVHLSFAKEHKRYTRFLAAHVLDLLLSATVQDVADHLGMSWDTVRDIEKPACCWTADGASAPFNNALPLMVAGINERNNVERINGGEADCDGTACSPLTKSPCKKGTNT